MFDRLQITLTLTERLLGGTPKNPELIKTWIASRAKPPVAGESQSAEEWSAERAAEIAQLVEPTEEKSWCGFQSDEHLLGGFGIFLPQIHMLAFLRDMASTLGYFKAVRGVRQTFQHTMAIDPPRIRFARNCAVLIEPDGYDEHAVHVMTPQGPRTSIVRSDYVEAGTTLSFTLLVATKREPKLSTEQILELFRLGGVTNGLGARRSQGFGRFSIEEAV